jgi:hypothetical protein
VTSAISRTATRRSFLIGLSASLPAAHFLAPTVAWASISQDVFLRASQTITGSMSLSPAIAARIHDLLQHRDKDFDGKLADLAAAFDKSGGDRQTQLAALSDAQVKLALQIAKPWYVGYVGKPSNFVLKDDAEFATFIDVQSWQKIIDAVPLPTYPSGNASWWQEAPSGVVAPAMPAKIIDWTFHPGGPPQIQPPDPAWRDYAAADHADLNAARAAKPQASN